MAHTEGPSVTFVELADPLLNDAYRLAGYLLGSEADAEDAVQEALARAWQAWPTLSQPDRFESWFDRILVNICRDRMRRKRRRPQEELHEGIADRSDDPFQATLVRLEIGGLVRELNPDQRVVVALRFWRDLPLQEIADVIGVPLGTVQSRLHYALQGLRKAAEKAGADDGARRPTGDRSQLEPSEERAGAARYGRGGKR